MAKRLLDGLRLGAINAVGIEDVRPFGSTLSDCEGDLMPLLRRLVVNVLTSDWWLESFRVGCCQISMFDAWVDGAVDQDIYFCKSILRFHEVSKFQPKHGRRLYSGH